MSRLTKKSMEEGVKTVDSSGTAVATKDSQGAPAGEKTAETLLSEANARIAKVEEERDNYRKGMLKAKGKLDDNEEVDPAEIARQAALEAIANSDLGKALKERDEFIVKTMKENSELRLSVKNRPSGSTASRSEERRVGKEC